MKSCVMYNRNVVYNNRYSDVRLIKRCLYFFSIHSGFFDFAVLGDVTINDPSPHHVKRLVKDVYSYRPNSNISFNSVDLALVRLSHPVQLNDHVNIACLPPPGLPFRVNATCYIIGWGYVEMNGT